MVKNRELEEKLGEVRIGAWEDKTLTNVVSMIRMGRSIARIAFREKNIISMNIKCGELLLDIDVFDPSIAPGTGSPEVNGLQYWQVREIIKEVASKSNIVGVDLVEVNPMVDSSGLTATTATQILLELLGQVHG